MNASISTAPAYRLWAGQIKPQDSSLGPPQGVGDLLFGIAAQQAAEHVALPGGERVVSWIDAVGEGEPPAGAGEHVCGGTGDVPVGFAEHGFGRPSIETEVHFDVGGDDTRHDHPIRQSMLAEKGNACDRCDVDADQNDRDGDGLPDACDPCPDAAANDSDGGLVCDRMDTCLPGDDREDMDSDGIPDACGPCPIDGDGDSDEDGTCDAADICDGDDRTGDLDGDGVYADRDCDDTRATVYPGADEICDGFDSNCSGAIPLNEFDRDGDLVIDCLAEEPSGGCSSAGDSAAPAWLALIGLVGLFALRRRSV